MRHALPQTYELHHTDNTAPLLRNLSHPLHQNTPLVTANILQTLHEILTVNHLLLPTKLPHSLSYTNSIENIIPTLPLIRPNVKRSPNAAITLRYTTPLIIQATNHSIY